MNNDRAHDAPAGVPISRGNLRQQVTGRLLVGIFQGRLSSGERLVVQQLADLYRVSPTPVRESLVELASLGLVALAPNRGAVVRPFGPKEVREISQVRRVLEVEATRGATGRLEPADLAKLEADLARLQDRTPGPVWDRRVRDLDTQLHSLIARACGSDRLAAEIERYLDLFRTLRDVSHRRDSGTNYSRSNDLPEHLEIVRALRADDADAAARAMDRHIRSAARNLEEVVFGGPIPARAGPIVPPGPRFAEG